MNYQGSPDHRMSRGSFKAPNQAFVVVLLFLASVTSAFSQTPEIRKAFRYYNIEQPSKMIPALEQATKSSPENLYYLGVGYIMQGDLDKALATFEKGIQAEDKDPLPVAGKGHVKILQKNAAEGKALLTKAADMNRKKTAAQWEAIGRGYLADSKFLLDAIAALEKAKALDGGDPEVHLLLGDAYLQQNQGGQSVSAYERAASADPQWALPLYKIAKVYQRSRNEAVVFENLSRAVQVDPEFAPAWKELAQIHYLKKEPAKAVAAMEKYLSITENPGEGKFQLAFFHVMNKDYEKANVVFKEVLSNRNASATAWKFYGLSLLEQKKFDEAKPVFEKFFQVAKPEEVQSSDYASYGRLLLEMKQDSLANEALAKGILLDTAQQDFELMLLQADTYRKRQKFEEAADAYETLIKAQEAAEQPASSSALFWLGWTNYYSTEFVEADSALTKLTKQQPESSVGYLWAAKARVQIDSTGEQGLAVPMYQQYLEKVLTNPSSIEKEKKNIIEAYDYLGTYAIQTKKDVAEATTYFKKILELDPKNERAEDFFQTLKDMNNPNPTRGRGK